MRHVVGMGNFPHITGTSSAKIDHMQSFVRSHERGLNEQVVVVGYSDKVSMISNSLRLYLWQF